MTDVTQPAPLTAAERLRRFIDGYLTMGGLDAEVVHSAWVNNEGEARELRISDLRALLADAERAARALEGDLGAAIDAMAEVLNRLDLALELEHAEGHDCPVCRVTAVIPFKWLTLVNALRAARAEPGQELRPRLEAFVRGIKNRITDYQDPATVEWIVSDLLDVIEGRLDESTKEELDRAALRGGSGEGERP